MVETGEGYGRKFRRKERVAETRREHLTLSGQETNYSYFNNAGDQRLEQIQNLKPDTSNLSTFTYTYDAEGIIQTWSKKYDAGSVLTSTFKYDRADQLTEALVPQASGPTPQAFYYRYDKAGNRTSEQIDNAVNSGAHNNLNQLTALSATGPIRFEGSVNEAGTVKVNGQVLPVASDHTFQGDVSLPPGSNTVTVEAKDIKDSKLYVGYHLNSFRELSEDEV